LPAFFDIFAAFVAAAISIVAAIDARFAVAHFHDTPSRHRRRLLFLRRLITRRCPRGVLRRYYYASRRASAYRAQLCAAQAEKCRRGNMYARCAPARVAV